MRAAGAEKCRPRVLRKRRELPSLDTTSTEETVTLEAITQSPTNACPPEQKYFWVDSRSPSLTVGNTRRKQTTSLKGDASPIASSLLGRESLSCFRLLRNLVPALLAVRSSRAGKQRRGNLQVANCLGFRFLGVSWCISGVCTPRVVLQANVIRDETGRSRGFGFVLFLHEGSATAAVAASPHNLNEDNWVGTSPPFFALLCWEWRCLSST